jgi:hypothetical protein
MKKNTIAFWQMSTITANWLVANTALLTPAMNALGGKLTIINDDILALDIERLDTRFTKGTTAAKTALIEELSAFIGSTGAALHGYAISIGNVKMAKDCRRYDSPSKIKNMSSAKAIEAAETILKLANMHSTDIAAYGIDGTVLADATAKYSDYRAIANEPRQQVAAAKTLTARVLKMKKEVSGLLLELDLAAKSMLVSSPNLIKDYFNARIIVDAPTNRTTVTITVKDSNGNPVDNAAITFRNVQTQQPPKSMDKTLISSAYIGEYVYYIPERGIFEVMVVDEVKGKFTLQIGKSVKLSITV